MKLKIKILLLVFLVSLVSVVGTLVTITTNYYDDKKLAIYENHTYSALNISTQLSQYEDKLELIAKELDLISIGADYPEIEHIVTINDTKIDHIYENGSEITPSSYTKLLSLGHKTIFSLNKYLGFNIFIDLNGNEEINVIFLVNSNFIEKMAKRGQAVGVGILNLGDLSVINLGNDKFNFVAPDESFFSNVISKTNVSAKLMKTDKGEVLTVLSPLGSDSQTFVIVQAWQQQIINLVIENLKNSYLTIFILLIVFLSCAYYLSQSITAPIEYLTQATKRFSVGEWDLSLTDDRNDELGTLSKSFGLMGRELEKREKELKIINQKLVQNEKLASLGMLSAGIAHEVKNPLGAILANAQLVKRKTDNEDVLRYSSMIIDESYRANDIVQDLLVFAKERELKIESINLSEYASKIESLFKALCDEKHIELKISYSDFNYSFDSQQMIQVIQNIGLNAIDAIEESDHNLGVLSIKFANVNDVMEISICDNGLGMSEEEQRKIFEPFYSSKKIKNGTGLGMAICYGIISKHNGTIDIESELGKGSNFIIRI